MLHIHEPRYALFQQQRKQAVFTNPPMQTFNSVTDCTKTESYVVISPWAVQIQRVIWRQSLSTDCGVALYSHIDQRKARPANVTRGSCHLLEQTEKAELILIWSWILDCGSNLPVFWLDLWAEMVEQLALFWAVLISCPFSPAIMKSLSFSIWAELWSSLDKRAESPQLRLLRSVGCW